MGKRVDKRGSKILNEDCYKINRADGVCARAIYCFSKKGPVMTRFEMPCPAALFLTLAPAPAVGAWGDRFVGVNYGWGGLFLPFGVALPRHRACLPAGGDTAEKRLGGRSVRMRRLSVKRADTTISSCDMYLLCRTARKRARISTAFRSVSRHAVLIMRRRFFSRWKLGSLHSARKTDMFFIQISSPILQITRLL